ncbi:MAG: hypothetical protein WC670_19065 [Pseudolabrys sp.]|jgi:hypothetical protein
MSDLILNGDFSFPNISGPTGYLQFIETPPFSWHIAWVNSATVGPPKAEVQKNVPDGQYLEIASSAPYQITQTIQPNPGEDYVFSFRAKARSGFPSQFLARLSKPDGVVVEYHITPGSTWHNYTFCQCPTTGKVEVTFVGLGTSDGGAFIDSVHYVN